MWALPSLSKWVRTSLIGCLSRWPGLRAPRAGEREHGVEDGYHSTVKRRLFVLFLSATLTCQAPAAGLPDLGDVGAGDLSPLAERRVGEQAMRDIRFREQAYVEDPEIEDYLNDLGQRLAAHAPETAQSFRFFAVGESTLNAFALPGGFIGVHTGLITAAKTESELASVLGHEIAHVTQRHIAQLVANQGTTGMIMLASILVAILAASRNPQAAEAALATGSAAGIQSQLAYSRDFEREADRVGLQILQGAGFDVRGMEAFFERLQRSSRLYENNAPVYMRTHPLTTERISDIGNRVSQMRYRQVAGSETFHLVRAKLIVDAAPPGVSVEGMHLLDDQAADVRGYARALVALKAGRAEEARAHVAKLSPEWRQHPMVDFLLGEILRAQRDLNTAVAHFRRAVAAWPGHRALAYGLIETLVELGRHGDAVVEARSRISGDSDDVRMWSLLSRAQAGRGSSSGRHRAQAEVFRIQGAWRAAVEQLELARAAGDADFYEASAIDARLREFRRQLQLAREPRADG
ncbi:MAG: M48 family metallopeptidase [Rhodocyclaceae bacterium]|nr:M48 family metallopeptidase [Rhodocyclaceae bacterium]